MESGLTSITLIFEIPTPKSRRLTLRAIREDDLNHFLTMSRDPEVTSHLHEGPPPSEGVVWQRMAMAMAMALGQWALRGYGMMAVEDSDGFIGRLGVHHPFDAPPSGRLHNLPTWPGKGYATDGGGLILDWMFRTHGPQRLVSEIARENIGSARIASKLGAQLEKTILREDVTFDIWAYPPRA